MLQTDQSYRGYRFLNASIPGTNFYELSTIIDYLLNIDGDIKVVILTLDFLTFLHVELFKAISGILNFVQTILAGRAFLS